jgi:hypothetical protein
MDFVTLNKYLFLSIILFRKTMKKSALLKRLPKHLEFAIQN